ncbi:MAG: hypothetical protein DHS20C16_29420 [Phycisphaerae bacterium]|nr:MAG: hypothetical protein DHS20C16_29420 [Phycisphaerae bacterium]
MLFLELETMDMKKTNKALKCAATVAVLGTCFHSIGCNFGGLGRYLGQFLAAIPAAAVSEFLLDNDGIFDLFEDGSTAANP